MSTNINPSKNNFLFHYQKEKVNSVHLPLLLPRLAWISQVTYLQILFKVKKRLDQIEEARVNFSDQ